MIARSWARRNDEFLKETWDALLAARPIPIVASEPLGASVRRVTFDDGAAREVGLSENSARSRWFRTLPVPTAFADAKIIHDGRALQWVTGADYCADAHCILADRQNAGRR
jgi:hypothetical protein